MPEENKRPDQNLRTLHQALVADKFYQENIPQQYEEFVALYSQPENARNLHAALAADKFYEENVPKDFNEAMSLYGLGKPSAEPRGASGLAQKSVGSPMVTETPAPTQPTQSSAPQYLSPEELGGVQTMEAEVQPMPQTIQREAPTREEIKQFDDPELQKALRLEYLKKKAEESKTKSESYKGSLLGAVYNSVIEGVGKTLEGTAYTLGVLFGGDSEQFGDQDESERIEELNQKIEKFGLKKTIDQNLKDKGTTQEFIERTKEEGGIVAQGALGLAESLPAMVTPAQVGFFFQTFEGAHKDISKEMPNASPAVKALYASTQGTVAMALEQFGLSNLVQNKSVMKTLTGRVIRQIQEMGVKMTPEVTQSAAARIVNGFLAEAETGGSQYVAEESIKQIADAIEGEKDVFEFEGWKKFLSNTLEASAAEGVGGSIIKGLGEAVSAIRIPKNKEKVKKQSEEMIAMVDDFNNPNVSPEAKEAIKKQIDQKAEEILDAYAEEQETVAKLPQQSIDKINDANAAIDRFNSIVNDPNVSDASKAMAEENIKALTQDIEIILESAPTPEAAPEVEETVEVTEEQPEPLPVAEEVVAEEEVASQPEPQEETPTENPALADVESTTKVLEGDPDLENIDPIIQAARNGDKEAQKRLEKFGLDWEQTTTYRFVGQSEVDVLLANEKVSSKRGMADAGIDVTTNEKVTTATSNEYRVTFKESFDVNNGLGKVKAKNRELGDHNLERGRGYDINDVAKIERLDENGNAVETIYDVNIKRTLVPTPQVNPQSVQAVENLLTPPTNETQIETQAEAASTEAAVPQAERGGASQEEAVNQVPADTAVEVEEGALTPRAEELLQNSLSEYQQATPERQSEMIAQVKEQLSINEKGEQAIGMGLDADFVAAGKEFLRQVEPQTPTQDATQEGNIEQGNLSEREGITEQQQGEGADRLDQETNVQEGEAEASGSDSIEEGRAEQKIAQTAKSIADVIRQGKINKPGYLQASAGAIVWDGAIEVIATAVEKGGDLAQAIADGFEHIRKSDYYKGLTEKDRRRFIKDFTRSVNQLRRDYELPLDPILSIGEMDMSSLKTRLIKGTKLPKYVKDGIEEKGIAYDVENQDLARDYANALIDILGLDAAVDLALKGKVKGGTKTFILGANVDAFASTPNTPEFFEAVEIFDEALRTAGEEISAAYRVYLNSPDGLYHYERKRVRKEIDAQITEGEKGKNIEATKKKAKRTRKEKAKDVAKEVVDGLSGKNDPTVTEKKVNPDAAKKKAALDKLAKAKEKLRKARGIATTGGLNPEAIEALVEIGVANIELGYLNAKAWLRKMKEDIKGIVDVSDAELLDILETAKDTDGKSLAEKMEEAKWDAAKEKLAQKIASSVKEPNSSFDPVQVLIETLFNKATQFVDKKKAEKLTPLQKAKIAVENYANAQKIWEDAKGDVTDLIDQMDIEQDVKDEYLAQLEYFFEETIGFPISEGSAREIIKKEISELIGGESNLRNSVEKILAQSVDGQARSKQELIDSISEKLELDLSLSPAQAEYIAKQFANRYEAVVSEEMKKFLNQQFPDRVKENQKEKEKQNAAIVREIIWGALNDSEFASKFYEKYGFGYVNDPAFNQELRRLAENIYKAPQGFLKQQAMDELASYVRVSRDGIRYWSLPMNLMVNNLLLGPETFLKAIDSNTIQTIAATGQMIASDPKNTKFYLEKMFKEQGEGVINLQLRKIGFWMGIKGIQSYRDSDVAGLELGKELEKYGKSKFARGFGKYIQMSNKGLSAVDLIYSKSGEFAKFAQLVLRNIQIENNKLPKDQRATKAEMQALANEILGNTSDRAQAAYTQALKEIKETFGVDEVVMGKKNPSKEEVALKARIIEILEQGRAERLNDVKQKVDWLDAFTEKELEIFTKYSKMYGEKISLMGTPRGSAGFMSLSLQGLGRNAPILKYIQVAPIFVNAPMNFGNLVIDSTPLGILRAGIFAAKGRRGALIGREQALRQGEITRTESEMIYTMERNALIARVVTLNVMTYVGLAAMGFNFFRSPDDEEEEFTMEKFKKMPYYVTAGISPSREKVIEVEKAFGIEPYTVYSYGRKVLNYRNSAMIAPLAMQGAMMDAQNFRTDDIESNLDLFAAASIATIAFISEQSAVKGASEALGAMAGIGKYEKDVELPDRLIEAAKRNLASTTKAMIMPRLIPALYKDFQGIMEMDKTRATTFKDFLVEDVPFLEDMIVTKQVDHFGEPIKEEFFMPSPFGGLSLIGWDKGFFKGPFNEITQANPYYQLAFEAGYTPKAYRDDKLTKEMTAKEFETFQPLSKAEIAAKKETDVTGIYIVELDLTPEQVAEINKLRGKYVKDYLDDNMTKFKKYSKSERKEIFERLFEVGTKYAKTKVTGVDYVGSGNFRIEKLEIDLPSMK